MSWDPIIQLRRGLGSDLIQLRGLVSDLIQLRELGSDLIGIRFNTVEGSWDAI